MILIIPTLQGVGQYRQRTQLDGSDYLLDFLWNDRAGCWMLSLFTVDEAPIAMGMKVISNFNLLRRYHDRPGCPPGEIRAIDTTFKIDAANYTQLGPEVSLCYVDQETLRTLEPASSVAPFGAQGATGGTGG